MARLLADRDSTNLHLSLARRHERLARRYGQAGLAAPLAALVADLKSKQTQAEEKLLDRQSAYDDVIAADGDLDDSIRNLYNSAEIHDRANPGATTLPILFPEGGFGAIIEEPTPQQPATADALATKVSGLGQNHPLAIHAQSITQRAEDVRSALRALDSAVRAQKTAEAEEELAQAAMRRQYEVNYFEARKTLGRVVAERLFPRASRAASEEELPTPPAPVG